jgi:hypothetical protein
LNPDLTAAWSRFHRHPGEPAKQKHNNTYGITNSSDFIPFQKLLTGVKQAGLSYLLNSINLGSFIKSVWNAFCKISEKFIFEQTCMLTVEWVAAC